MSLTPEVYAAYRNTDYVVLTTPPITLRIAEACAELDGLLARSEKRTAAFLTAWNPYSELKTQEQNDCAQGALLEDLRQRGCVVIEGEGRGRIDDWPPEKSVLAIGIDRAGAEEVGRRFGQNAIVFHEIGCPSRLVTLVDMMFGASQTEGPDLDLREFTGLEFDDHEEERLWESTTCLDLVRECPSVEEFKVLDVEGMPGMSDTYYDYRVSDPEAFREELRVSIATCLNEPRGR